MLSTADRCVRNRRLSALLRDLVVKRITECDTVPLPGSDVCVQATQVVHAFAEDVKGGCRDVPVPYSDFSCAQQKGWGKCGEYFMRGYCDLTCGRCGSEGGSNNEKEVAAAAASEGTSKEQFQAGRQAALEG